MYDQGFENLRCEKTGEFELEDDSHCGGITKKERNKKDVVKKWRSHL